MMEFSDSYRPIIAWVDHDKKGLKKILDTIGKLKLMRSTKEPLKDSCELVPIIIRTAGTLVDRVNRAITKLDECSRWPDLILVDLVFDDEGNYDAIEKGLELALELQNRKPFTPVGVYTRHSLQPIDRARISTDLFAVLLEDVNKMYAGTTSERLRGDVWFELFKNSIMNTRKSAIPPHALSVPGEDTATWADGHPLHRSRSFVEAAPKLAALALKSLSPPGIVLSELGGGFSGSYVLKAEISNKAAFVIKIDEDATRLKKEVEGHLVIQKSISHEYYLPLIGSGVNWPVTLYENWWGALAMSYEGKAKPLIEQSNLEGVALAKIYERVWKECLYGLYESSEPHQVSVRKDVVSKDTKDEAQDGYETLIRYEGRLDVLEMGQRDCVERARSFIKKTIDIELENDDLFVSWSRQVHGDLNCRNILYDTEKDRFYLIDFPNVGNPSPLATDFVKAEAELLLIMMDWNTGYDCDVFRLAIWGLLTDSISFEFIPDQIPSGDTEINRVFIAVKAIRNAYLEVASDVGDPVLAYRLYLLSRILRYVGYPDLTVAKKFLALLWAGQLLKAFAR